MTYAKWLMNCSAESAFQDFEVKMPLINTIQSGFRIVEEEISMVKEGFNDWVIFLQRENNELKDRVGILERKVRDLEIFILKMQNRE